MKITKNQLERINLIEQDIDMFLSDYSCISKDFKITEGYDDGSVRLEVTFKSTFGKGEITFYFEVYENRYQFEIGDDMQEEFTEANFWKQMVFELWK